MLQIIVAAMSRPSLPRRFDNVRVLSFTFLALILPPSVLLLGAAEATVRVKYFLSNGHDWNYLTTPFVRRSPSLPKGASFAGPATVDQIVFQWPEPCVSRQVYSTEHNALMPRTWDQNCFRGDHSDRETGISRSLEATLLEARRQRGEKSFHRVGG